MTIRLQIPILATLLIVAMLMGCGQKVNPYFCPGNPDNNCTEDGGVRSCTSDGQCGVPEAVCDTQSMTCVECTTAEASACSGTNPVCGTDDKCRGCSAHSECPASNVCLPDGSCATADQVAYVSGLANMDNMMCSMTSPCKTVTGALATMRPHVKIHGTVVDTVLVNNGRQVDFLADPDAKLTSIDNSPIVTVEDTGTILNIYDLTISDASNQGNGSGISIPELHGAPAVSLTRVTLARDPALGIVASGAGVVTISQTTITGNTGGGISLNAGTLTISQSTISNNGSLGISVLNGALTVSRSTIIGNNGGGIQMTSPSGVFDIENNFIIYNINGSSPPKVGGVALTTNTSGSKFQWNTIAFNQSDGTNRGGVTCTGSMVSAQGNLIYHNSENAVTSLGTQWNMMDGCQYGNTLAVDMDAANLGFKSATIAPYDFRLTALTPHTIVDAGGMCTGVDFEGDTRPIGPACDLGADEYHP